MRAFKSPRGLLSLAVEKSGLPHFVTTPNSNAANFLTSGDLKKMTFGLISLGQSQHKLAYGSINIFSCRIFFVNDEIVKSHSTKPRARWVEQFEISHVTLRVSPFLLIYFSGRLEKFPEFSKRYFVIKNLAP